MQCAIVVYPSNVFFKIEMSLKLKCTLLFISIEISNLKNVKNVVFNVIKSLSQGVISPGEPGSNPDWGAARRMLFAWFTSFFLVWLLSTDRFYQSNRIF